MKNRRDIYTEEGGYIDSRTLINTVHYAVIHVIILWLSLL